MPFPKATRTGWNHRSFLQTSSLFLYPLPCPSGSPPPPCPSVNHILPCPSGSHTPPCPSGSSFSTCPSLLSLNHLSSQQALATLLWTQSLSTCRIPPGWLQMPPVGPGTAPVAPVLLLSAPTGEARTLAKIPGIFFYLETSMTLGLIGWMSMSQQSCVFKLGNVE